jgi:hypothetical protein
MVAIERQFKLMGFLDWGDAIIRCLEVEDEKAKWRLVSET